MDEIITFKKFTSFFDIISHINVKIKEKRLETLDEFTDRLREKQWKTLRNKLFGRFRSSIFPFGSRRYNLFDFLEIITDLLPPSLSKNVQEFIFHEMKFDKVYDHEVLRFTKSKTFNDVIFIIEYQNITTSV